MLVDVVLPAGKPVTTRGKVSLGACVGPQGRAHASVCTSEKRGSLHHSWFLVQSFAKRQSEVKGNICLHALPDFTCKHVGTDEKSDPEQVLRARG